MARSFQESAQIIKMLLSCFLVNDLYLFPQTNRKERTFARYGCDRNAAVQ